MSIDRLSFSLLPIAIVLSGCHTDVPDNAIAKERTRLPHPTIINRTAVAGFDPDGEPEIREMSDGTLIIAFNFMPPSFAEDDEEGFADFDKQLEKALAVPVHWEDRELFVIRKPAKDTAEKARVFLEGYRKHKRG